MKRAQTQGFWMALCTLAGASLGAALNLVPFTIEAGVALPALMVMLLHWRE